MYFQGCMTWKAILWFGRVDFIYGFLCFKINCNWQATNRCCVCARHSSRGRRGTREISHSEREIKLRWGQGRDEGRVKRRLTWKVKLVILLGKTEYKLLNSHYEYNNKLSTPVWCRDGETRNIDLEFQYARIDCEGHSDSFVVGVKREMFWWKLELVGSLSSVNSLIISPSTPHFRYWRRRIWSGEDGRLSMERLDGSPRAMSRLLMRWAIFILSQEITRRNYWTSILKGPYCSSETCTLQDLWQWFFGFNSSHQLLNLHVQRVKL